MKRAVRFTCTYMNFEKNVSEIRRLTIAFDSLPDWLSNFRELVHFQKSHIDEDIKKKFECLDLKKTTKKIKFIFWVRAFYEIP